MPLTIGDIIERRVRVQLRDTDAGGVQWKDWELLEWFNEALAEVPRLRPETASTIADIPLVSGALQSLPVGASRLLEGICNMVGGVEHTAVRHVQRSTLDNEDRNWMMAAQAPQVVRYMSSTTTPRSFFVYPPNDGTGVLRAAICTPPDGVDLSKTSTAINDASMALNFPLPAEYAAPVANYILFRATAKMTEDPELQQRSAAFYQLFERQMGISNESHRSNNARTNDPVGPGV